MFTHILVPLDGSPRAESSLPVVARIARASGGSIVFVQVVSPPVDYGGGLAAGGSLLTGEMIETEMEEATSYLKTVASSPVLAGIETTSEVMFGSPAMDILAVAESREVDLIVMCSHGRTGFTRWILGSVAHQLVHQSAVPVLVLRESEPPLFLSHADTKRSVCAFVPLDGSPLAETALVPAAHLVAALAAPAQGVLHLAQVVKIDRPMVAGGFASELHEGVLNCTKAYLAKVIERLQATLKDLKLSITWSVSSEADVADALVGMAEYGSAGKETGDGGGNDLIAISTHGRGAVERWVMGSVTERLLNTTKLPMLIVRPQKIEEETPY